jgi:hypothetical protein
MSLRAFASAELYRLQALVDGVNAAIMRRNKLRLSSSLSFCGLLFGPTLKGGFLRRFPRRSSAYCFAAPVGDLGFVCAPPKQQSIEPGPVDPLGPNFGLHSEGIVARRHDGKTATIMPIRVAQIKAPLTAPKASRIFHPCRCRFACQRLSVGLNSEPPLGERGLSLLLSLSGRREFALWRASDRLLMASRSSSGSAMKGLSLPGHVHRLHSTQPISRSPW